MSAHHPLPGERETVGSCNRWSEVAVMGYHGSAMATWLADLITCVNRRSGF